MVTIEIGQKLRELMGREFLDGFRHYLVEHGRLDPLLFNKRTPHPVHFMEGMIIRNKMRKISACSGWTEHQLNSCWKEAVLMALYLEDVSFRISSSGRFP